MHYCRVRIENYAGLWLLLKEQFKNLLHMCEHGWIALKINGGGVIYEAYNFDSAVSFTQHSQNFRNFNRISEGNRNGIRKYFSLFIRGPDGSESWKNKGQKCIDVPSVAYGQVFICQSLPPPSLRDTNQQLYIPWLSIQEGKTEKQWVIFFFFYLKY